MGLFDCNAISTADALVAAYTAANSQLANIDLKWNTVDTVTAIFIKYLAGIANNKTIEGEDRYYDATIEGTFKLDGPHYASDFDALEFQEVTPSHMEGYKEGVSTKFIKPLRAFFVDKLYIPFADAAVLNAVKSVWGDGIGVSYEQASTPTTIPALPNTITEFSELSLFTNIKTITANKFSNFTSLRSFGFANITEINGQGAFYNTTSLNIDIIAPELLRITHFEMYNIAGAFANSAIKSFVAPKCTLIGSNGNENGPGTFQGCTNLSRVELPSVTSIERNAFDGCSRLSTIIINNVTPPSLGANVLANTPSTQKIYVPDAAVDTYKAATGWTTYASRIHPMSELPE